jgi:hypothetical protein
MDSDALFRMLYLRREHENVVSRIGELQGLVFVPDVVTSSGDDVWRGIVFVRLEASPWFGGSFPFTVVFPPKYPFHCPVATFDKPLRSLTLLQEDGVTVPFDAEYVGLEVMHVSVMMRLLVCIRRLFAPSEWAEESLSHLDLMACRRDVEQCSVTRDVFLNKPYVQLLNTEVSEWFVRTQGQREAAVGESRADVVKRPAESFTSWFTRTFVPSVKNLQ